MALQAIYFHVTILTGVMVSLYGLTKTIAERNKCKIYFWEQPFGKYLINFLQIVFMISIRNAFFALIRTEGKTVKYLFKDIVITKALRMGKS